mmetsp:Transcript_55626/g.143300  ORF Transcript_55626/g.143300 Transcript_55626/m.143300 type:complete len:372 (-) Transcript_55626:57-1172(-)
MEAISSSSKPARFTEGVKFLPVAFVWANIIGLYLIYMSLHALPRYRSVQHHLHGASQIVVFNIVTFLLVTCYVLCIMVQPGTVPDKEEDPTWEYVPQDERALGAESVSLNLQESKKSGDRRHCKWCAKYKPDRCHHCRVCRTCILKMDHHCPWIYNCVGFANHKYFFLLLFYTTIDTHIIIWTMMESVRAAVDPRTPFMTMFLLLFGETLASFLGLLVTTFFGFHIWLMMKAMTTIEFCEKSMKRTGYDASVYDRSAMGNLKAVLGDSVLLWFLPCSPPPGRGLVFVSEDMRLTKDMEVGRNARRRAHATLAPEPSTTQKRRSARPQSSGGTGSAPGSGQSEDSCASANASDVEGGLLPTPLASEAIRPGS